MNKVKGRNETQVLHSLLDVDYLSASAVYEAIVLNRELPAEKKMFAEVPIPFELIWPTGTDAQTSEWTISQEAQLAIAIREALIPARQASLKHLVDPGIWTWIALAQIPTYVISRWCGGTDVDGRPAKPSGCSFFLTGDGVHSQTRCASRRLFIAAETSFRSHGSYSHVEKFLQSSDIYSAIFERRLGLDAELATEMVDAFVDGNVARTHYRKAVKLVGLILGTTCLEALSREDKRKIVEEALTEVSSPIIEG